MPIFSFFLTVPYKLVHRSIAAFLFSLDSPVYAFSTSLSRKQLCLLKPSQHSEPFYRAHLPFLTSPYCRLLFVNETSAGILLEPSLSPWQAIVTARESRLPPTLWCCFQRAKSSETLSVCNQASQWMMDPIRKAC